MTDDEDAVADESAFAGDDPPHLPPEDQRRPVSDEALDTEAEGEGGPAGA